MKILKLSLIALVAGLAPHLFASQIDDLVLAIQEDPENTAILVQTVVADSPDQVHLIVSRLLADFPGLAEEVVYGAINGLEDPTPETVSGIVTRAVLYRPALANAIVAGAIRAAPEMETTIIVAARSGLRDGFGVIGRTTAPNGPEVFYDETLRVSPSN